MLKLNENEKIISWDVVVKTTDRCNAHGQGREISACDLGLDLPDIAKERIDNVLEEHYSCSWNEEDNR